MRRAWLPVLLVLVALLSGCVGSSKVNQSPPGSYGTLAVTVERPTVTASSSFLRNLLFPKVYATEQGQRMVRITVADFEGTARVSKDVLAEGRRVSTMMRVPARPAYKVVAAEYYREQVGDIWVMRITDLGMTYPITVGVDQTVTTSVALSSFDKALNPVITVDNYTAVAGEEVITGTVTIRTDFKLADLYIVSMTRDDPYCIKVAEYSTALVDQSSPLFRAMWTIRPIVFDHADEITCRFSFATEIVDARGGGFGMEDARMYFYFPEEPPYLEVTFYPPSIDVGF